MVTLSQIQLCVSDCIRSSGFTQSELAKYLGVTQQSISRYVRCETLPSFDVFANLCILLDLDPKKILCIK